MPWPKMTLRMRREQVRDDLGALTIVPNSTTRAIAESVASGIHDNDRHLDDFVVVNMMPDTATGEFADRWGNMLLPSGRKGAGFSGGTVTVRGISGSSVPTGAEFVAPGIDANGNSVTLSFRVSAGLTLTGPSGVVPVVAMTPGVAANLADGAVLSFVDVPGGIDGVATVNAPGFAGGAEQEDDASLVERYINRLQEPPHGGSRNDYVQWALEVPGVTSAWAASEMGIGTVTVRFMMHDVRSATFGIPTVDDVALVAAYIEGKRPVTVADCFVVAPIAQPLALTITDLFNEAPSVRANVAIELAEMLRARARPGGVIYSSWIVEAISSAIGEDHHEVEIATVVPLSAGHIVVPGSITYA